MKGLDMVFLLALTLLTFVSGLLIGKALSKPTGFRTIEFNTIQYEAKWNGNWLTIHELRDDGKRPLMQFLAIEETR